MGKTKFINFICDLCKDSRMITSKPQGWKEIEIFENKGTDEEDSYIACVCDNCNKLLAESK